MFFVSGNDRPRGGRTQTLLANRILPLLPPLIIAVAWEAAAFLGGGQFVPHISALVLAILGSFQRNPIIEAEGGGTLGYAPHIWATMKLFLTSFVFGAGAAFFASVLCFPWLLLRRTFHAALGPWHVVPPLIVIPLSFTFFGPSTLMFYLTIAFYAFVATAIYVLAALRDVSPKYINMARVAGAGRVWIAWKVRAPSALPVLIGPLKVVASFTLGVTIVVEFLAAPEGIGRVMKFAMSFNSATLILTGIFWSALIGLLFGVCLDQFGKRFLAWGFKGENETIPIAVLHREGLANR